jgi:hypothetical protein
MWHEWDSIITLTHELHRTVGNKMKFISVLFMYIIMWNWSPYSTWLLSCTVSSIFTHRIYLLYFCVVGDRAFRNDMFCTSQSLFQCSKRRRVTTVCSFSWRFVGRDYDFRQGFSVCGMPMCPVRPVYICCSTVQYCMIEISYLMLGNRLCYLMSSVFGRTYHCKQMFNLIRNVKSRTRTRLTD